MKNFTKSVCAIALSAVSVCTASAANLWIAGDATPSGWSLDDATALVSTAENPKLYAGTLFLKSGATFKFLTTTDFGNEEIGSAPDATLTDGKVALAEGKDDQGYGQISVAENANYYITVDTESMEATIVKSEYQATEITMASIFMVGSATENGWSVDAGTPLYQEVATPYVYAAKGIDMLEGTFKIATTIKGGGTWDGKYWYFRDADDAGKIALNQEGDLQWSIEKAGKYDISVNTVDNTISIGEAKTDGISDITAEDAQAPVYYNLQGVKIDNPTSGLYIRCTGNKATKVIL